MGENLLFFLIVGNAEDIQNALDRDKETITNHINKLKETMGYDVTLLIKSAKDITSYRDIIGECDGKTRIIIWYTGHGENLTETPDSFKEEFPCFQGTGIYIEQYRILEKLPRNILNAVIFDCCNNITSKPGRDTNTEVLQNISTIFDFEGEIMINSSKRGQSSFCRTNEGSEFTQIFFKKFCKTYEKTLQIVAEHCSSSIIKWGSLNYLKYDKDDELLSKEQVITSRKEREEKKKFERGILFRLLTNGDVETFHSGKEVRNDRLMKDMQMPI